MLIKIYSHLSSKSAVRHLGLLLGVFGLLGGVLAGELPGELYVELHGDISDNSGGKWMVI